MAKAPYSPLSDVAPTGGTGITQNISASPGETGGILGRSLEKLGGQIGQTSAEIGDMALKFQHEANVTNAMTSTSAAAQELGDAEVKYRSLQGSAAVAAYPEFQKTVGSIKEKYTGTLTSPVAQRLFSQDFTRYSDRAIFNAGLHAGDQQKTALLAATKGGIQSEKSNLVFATHVGQDPDFGPLETKVHLLADQMGLEQNGPARAALLQKETSDAMKDMISARVAIGDTAGADAMFQQAQKMKTPGTDLPLLDADHQASISTYIVQKKELDERRTLTAETRAQALKEKGEREAAEKAGNVIVTQMLKDPTSVDPAAIANNGSLKYEQKLSLQNALDAQLNRVKDGHDIKTYGTDFWPLFQRVHAAPGSPDALRDPTELYKHAGAGGGLTLAGVEKLTGEINGVRTPEGSAEGKMREEAIAYAKRGLSFEMDYGTFKMRDPKGENAFSVGFLPAFYQAYDEGRKAGKTPYQLLSRDSPDFIVDKVAAPFKRSDADRVRDQITAGAEVDKTGPTAIRKPPPAVGFVQSGFRFKGGDPAKQENWEAVAAPTPSAPLSR